MARFAGKVGYEVLEETAPGVYRAPCIIERVYKGDVIRNRTTSEPGQWLNDDVNINNEISIIADGYAYEHLDAMKYVVWMGTKWKIKSVEVERPRLILSIGGVYNESYP